MSQHPAGILHSGPQKKDVQVSINAPDAKERGGNKPVAPPPNPAAVSAPVVNAPVKDEVELLRQGIMNKLQAQNERLREQKTRCKNELEALASFAENAKQWRKSALFSHSISGVLPCYMEPKSRTSDDSGLTSDDTFGDKSALNNRQTFNKPVAHSIVEVPTASKLTLMTQSTSALLVAKRSPRRTALRVAPNSNHLNTSTNQSTNDSSSTLTTSTAMNLSTMNGSATSTIQAHASSSSSSPEISPFDEKRPVPIPRKVRPIMGGQMIFMGKSLRVNNQIERDSLNSFEVEDDYYEGDEDEVFDEIDCAQSVVEQLPCNNKSQLNKKW